MIAGQSEIKSRLDNVKLSYEGYKRQLTRPDLSSERQERLERDITLLEEEINTLDKLSHLVRLEPDGARVEAAVLERLGVVRVALGADEALSDYSMAEREQGSGEARALLWALGQDPLTLNMREMVKGHEHADPERTNRAIPSILIHTLEEAPDPQTRASAAYELGQLRIVEAIPNLAAALEDHPLVRDLAGKALLLFTQAELLQAGLSPAAVDKLNSPDQETTSGS